jgi:hypothetical protein
MLSPIFEDVHNLVAAALIRRRQRVFMNLPVWEIWGLDRLFGVGSLQLFGTIGI